MPKLYFKSVATNTYAFNVYSDINVSMQFILLNVHYRYNYLVGVSLLLLYLLNFLKYIISMP